MIQRFFHSLRQIIDNIMIQPYHTKFAKKWIVASDKVNRIASLSIYVHYMHDASLILLTVTFLVFQPHNLDYYVDKFKDEFWALYDEFKKEWSMVSDFKLKKNQYVVFMYIFIVINVTINILVVFGLLI